MEDLQKIRLEVLKVLGNTNMDTLDRFVDWVMTGGMPYEEIPSELIPIRYDENDWREDSLVDAIYKSVMGKIDVTCVFKACKIRGGGDFWEKLKESDAVIERPTVTEQEISEWLPDENGHYSHIKRGKIRAVAHGAYKIDTLKFLDMLTKQYKLDMNYLKIINQVINNLKANERQNS